MILPFALHSACQFSNYVWFFLAAMVVVDCELPNDHNKTKDYNDQITPLQYPDYLTKVPHFNVVLELKRHPVCSAVVISRRFLVSPCMDCVRDDFAVFPKEELQVAYPDLAESGAISPKRMNVAGVYVNEFCYGNKRYQARFDIAVIQTVDVFILKPAGLMPAKITKRQTFYSPSPLMFLSAYRYNQGAAILEDNVWFRTTYLIPPEVCEMILPPTSYNRYYTNCVTYYRKEAQECDYDKGMALSYEDYLVGLLIFKDCWNPKRGGSFVNIGLNSNWIRMTVSVKSNYVENV